MTTVCNWSLITVEAKSSINLDFDLALSPSPTSSADLLLSIYRNEQCIHFIRHTFTIEWKPIQLVYHLDMAMALNTQGLSSDSVIQCFSSFSPIKDLVSKGDLYVALLGMTKNNEITKNAFQCYITQYTYFKSILI